MQIAVIPFAATPISNEDSCYNSKLVKASPANVLAIQKFVKSKIALARSGNAGKTLFLFKSFDCGTGELQMEDGIAEDCRRQL